MNVLNSNMVARDRKTLSLESQIWLFSHLAIISIYSSVTVAFEIGHQVTQLAGLGFQTLCKDLVGQYIARS